LLITKRKLEDGRGRLRPALVFRLAPDAWARSGVQVADLVDSLPIVPGSALGRQITDASIAPDGRHVAVRTYSQVFVFDSDPATGRVFANAPSVSCNVASLMEEQGEGVTWRDATGELVLLSEGKHAPVHIARCRPPA
jgi:hypothetical protein